MAQSTPWILAAAGIVVANDAIFSPVIAGQKPLTNVNWRIIPATVIAGFALAGMEKISPELGKGLAVLGLLTALIVPLGSAQSPIDNAYKFLQKVEHK